MSRAVTLVRPPKASTLRDGVSACWTARRAPTGVRAEPAARCTIQAWPKKSSDEGRKAVFRIPRTPYLAIALLTICVTPIALGEIPDLQWLYLFPIALAGVRDRARAPSRRARGLRRADDVRQARRAVVGAEGPRGSPSRSRVSAVLDRTTRRCRCPTVRTRHLPVLALVSGGRSPTRAGCCRPRGRQAGRAGGPAQRVTARPTRG